MRKIFRGVDTGPWRLFCNMNGDPEAMPQGAQLLKRFELFERGLRQERELAQKPDPIGINSHMAQRLGQQAAGFPPGFSGKVTRCGDG